MTINMAKNKIFKHLHGPQERIGVLLVNLGSPKEPTAKAIRKYLAEFLWDIRVVDVARPLWWLILHGIILRFRPAKLAKKYQKIWTDQGSPLAATTRTLAQQTEKQLQKKIRGNIHVDFAMRYGSPSIADGLRGLRKAGAHRFLILPMYPQYSSTTTASVFDAMTSQFHRWRWLPDIRFINSYHDHPLYIEALEKSILQFWDRKKRRPEKLLFSFHGIPQRYFDRGDPYFCHCHKTARLVATKMSLNDDQWQVVFQSRFGKEEWLKPYCDETLKQLASNGVKTVDVICPGFSADCLETLEEIEIENRQYFLENGGEDFGYIPALNDSEDHLRLICELITQHSFGWPETMPNWDAGERAVEANRTRDRAIKMGAKE